MFFLFILKEKGFPVSQVFTDEIREIPTSRFSKNFDDEYKSLHMQFQHEKKLKDNKKVAKLTEDFLTVNRDRLTFNDRVSWSDRVYKRWNSWDSMDSNHAPLVRTNLDTENFQSRPPQVPVLDFSSLMQDRRQNLKEEDSTPSSN